ncbi:sensor histidine kinase [Sphaerisporangium fuscum]|uniref:sensor histidine kinase n=1 Tax=Sphaerisporangium fuscum TaxID=2835868 RepID=UPI001BDBCF4A|nr:sensor histidine kinase [Sphaerisporangium fuscum]
MQLRPRLVATSGAVRHLVVGLGLGLLALFTFAAVIIVAALTPFGVGLPAIPPLTVWARTLTSWQRRRVATRLGVPLPTRHRPLDGPLTRQVRSALSDPATYRDIAWLGVYGVIGTAGGYVAVALPLFAVNAFTVPLWWWAVPEPSLLGYPIDSWPAAFSGIAVGLGYTLLAVVLLDPLAAATARLSHVLLRPPKRVRLAAVSAARAAALEAHERELKRIERDLHDETQNRLVAVLMNLGMLERSLAEAPEPARRLAARAHDAASDALTHLRQVVRTIHPPVLTERGLDGAIAALAAGSPVPCTLTVEPFPRLPAAVETAAYFAVAEALTNLAKHSGATRAQVRLRAEADLLVAEVEDDGYGGARARPGGGLAGVDRRVAAFSGRTLLISPPGGPTVLRVELPCGL